MTDVRTFQKGFILVAPAVLFGLLVAAQWGTFASAVREDVAIRYVEPLNRSVSDLQADQDALRLQLAGLRAELEELRRTASAQSGATADLQGRLDSLREQGGLDPVTGTGILVTFEALTAGAEERPACVAPDLTDLTNAAWRAGALAVSINGERIVSSSSVYCVGSTIVVNGGLTSAPFEIQAIGDPLRLLAAYEDPQQLADLKRRRDERSVVLRTSTEPSLTVAAYTGPITVRSARIE